MYWFGEVVGLMESFYVELFLGSFLVFEVGFEWVGGCGEVGRGEGRRGEVGVEGVVYVWGGGCGG